MQNPRKNKEKYRLQCISAYVPICLRDWWLDAACGEAAWDVSLAFDQGGNITAALPYYLTKRWGIFAALQIPPLTGYAGPCYFYPINMPAEKRNSRYAFEKKATTALIEGLPPAALFRQNFRPEITNWLPFFWAGFRQTTRYTYILESKADLAVTYAGLKNTVRSDLKKAEKLAVVGIENDAALLFGLSTQSFHRKGKPQIYSFDVFKRLHVALEAHGLSRLWIARDRASGMPHAGLYLVFDERQATVFMTGLDPAFKASCAIHLLFWEAIKFCNERQISLDFDGSMHPEIEHVFRSFGGLLTPYFEVWHTRNKVLRLLFALK